VSSIVNQEKKYLGDENYCDEFVRDNKLVGDWRFEYKIYSIDGFIRALFRPNPRGTKRREF